MNEFYVKTQREIQDLVIMAKEGDVCALEEVYKTFEMFISKTAFTISLKNYKREDLVQIGNESIAKALNKYKLEDGRPFLPYVVTSIRKNFNNLIRNNNRYGCEESLHINNSNGFLLINIIPSLEVFEEDLLKKETHGELKQVIDKLNEDERQIIYYLFIREYRVSDFAKLKDLNYWVCKRKIGALLRKLKNLLTK